jgi:Zn-dependent M16 (insulinase) family peptidase
MRTGENKHGFRIESVAELPDVGGRLWRMTYLKNGADLLWLERKDDVKTFSIVFKTLPDDETGVAHILEHSVLAGSRRYPVRSPFEEIRKSSPCVYINA